MNKKTFSSLEFEKILSLVSKYAVLQSSKESIIGTIIDSDYLTCKYLLDKTSEAYKLLYTYGVSDIEFFDDLGDILTRVKKGSILSCGELLKVARLLRSLRICNTSILSITDDSIVLIKQDAQSLYTNNYLEKEIFSKIISEDTISDNASEKLYQIRQNIIRINERIHERLQQYIKKGASDFLQDNIISVRNGRYVIPVKTEHRQRVKGFIHDRSTSGSTLFIEPTEVLELNNDLREEMLNEQAEIERILAELSGKISVISNNLEESKVYLQNIDIAFAKAHYSYSIKATRPILQTNGYIDIKNGRHPLIDKDKVVPVSITLGKDYNYILISGPNTGGKTVTLKLVGLFTLMAMSGLFIPCYDDSVISIFDKIFVDIGDEQSIEQSLSTFSSHLKNIVYITENADNKSLILIDEIGAGTDPEEGGALAKAIIERLISVGSFGIITTHYTMLKEYAFSSKKIINACMDFDADTFMPLYRVRLGTAGSSNAIEVAKKLGISEEIYQSAKSNLTTEKRNFDKVLLEAEKIRTEAEKDKVYIQNLKKEEQEIYDKLLLEKEKLEKDKKNLYERAKLKAKREILDKLDEAEEMLQEMKDIFKKDEYSSGDIVKMASLKNKIADKTYSFDSSEDVENNPYKQVDIETLKKGDNVFVKSMSTTAIVDEVNVKKKSVWVYIGSIKYNAKVNDLYFIKTEEKPKTNLSVSVKRATALGEIKTEINVIGKQVEEALTLVDAFLDSAVLSNIEVVRIVHGKGLRILATNIQKALKNDKRVKEYRFGRYGEGEDGVTIVTLK